MQESDLFWIIQSIDKQIGKCSNKTLPYSAMNLLELRNSILRKFKPSPSFNWCIQDQMAVKILEKINWTVTYE